MRLAASTSVFAIALLVVSPATRAGTVLPAGFSETRVASGLNSPVAMAVAPDGRIFVCQQGGQLVVIKNGTLLATPFVTVPSAADDEQGLVGVALDPDFSSNRYVYVTYTASNPTKHNRVSRFTANGDVAVSGSEQLIFSLDTNVALYHIGGALAFGADGKLFITTGDNANGDNATSMDTLHGKVLRINKDGSIPADNPFFATASGRNRAIWAYGFRNAFTIAVQPGTNRVFTNDVGASDWEEVNEVFAGANYGWPAEEGPSSDPAVEAPIHAYPHGAGTDAGSCIAGGAFYNPPIAQFPKAYRGAYFFADYTNAWISRLDPANGNAVSVFANGTFPAPIDVDVDADGNLYYLARGQVTLDGGAGPGWDTGAVFKISFTGTQMPSISAHPSGHMASVGDRITFEVRASGPEPIHYQWQRNNVTIPGSDSATYRTPPATLADDGAVFRAIVTNDFGSAVSQGAVLDVIGGSSPAVTIVSPRPNDRYRAGETLEFFGTAIDAEDGVLGPPAFSWRIDFHHDTHTHPAMPETPGIESGSFLVPERGETSDNVWYRVYLSVKDSQGLQATKSVDVLPNKSTMTFTTDPPGLDFLLDAGRATTPVSATGVTGIVRSIGAISPQSHNGRSYTFVAWSDGGASSHEIKTPEADTTFVARFREVVSGEEVVTVDWGGDYVTYDNNLRGYITREHPVDIDGGNNDARAYCAYSDTVSLNPQQDYAHGSSWKFYGGVLMVKHNADFAYAYAEVWSNAPHNPNDQHYYGADTNTDGYDFRFWKKEDFLNGAAGGTVVFGSQSRLEILDYQGGDGVVANNSGRVRFVVKDGNQFYVSEDYGDNTTASFTLNDPNSRKWAPYNPSAPYDIQFAWKTAAFAPHVFGNITAVGYYHSNDNSTSPTRKAGFTAQRFRVTLSGAMGGAQTPGDCNQDGRLDLSDGICLLTHLFGGATTPLPCDGATINAGGTRTLLNFNGDAKGVDLSDAVGLLHNLFLGSPPHVLGTECSSIAGCQARCAGQ